MLRIDETPNSRSSQSEPLGQTREYTARGEFDENYVRAAAYSQIPKTISVIEGTLHRQDISIEAAGHKLYRITVPYAKKKKDTGTWTFSFDTTGGTAHITSSKETITIYDEDNPAGAFPATAAPKHNYKNLIGYNGEDVAGTDIIIPSGKFTVEFRHPLGVVTTAYMKYVFDLVGTVNDTQFFSFPPGEVLFLGCSGSDGSEAEATLSYSFAHEKNDEALQIGGFTVDKFGWEYAWIRFKKEVGDGAPLQIPEAVIIERVYEYIDLAGMLGFGEGEEEEP